MPRLMPLASLALPSFLFFGLPSGGDESGLQDSEWRHVELFDLSVGRGEPDVSLRAGGRVALDFTRYGPNNAKANGFELPIVRPLVEGHAYGTDFRVELDAVGVDSKRHSFDVWAGRDLADHVSIKVGQLRVAMASEYATREENFPLVGFGFTSYLTGRYDLGVRGEAGLFGDAVGLEATIGSGHGFGLEGEGKDDPIFVGRATWQPLRSNDSIWLRGLYLGAAAGFQPEFNDEIRITTPTQSTIFVTRDLDADRALWGAIEAGWFVGPFRVAYEGAHGILKGVELPAGGEKDLHELWAWTAYASVFLTGESAEWTRGHWTMPRWNPESMPLELSARYSNCDLDREFFKTGLTTYDPSSQETRTFSLDLTWYPDAGIRTVLGWVKTLADDDLSTFGGTARDSTIFLRLEFDF
jgi:hypothetical protein